LFVRNCSFAIVRSQLFVRSGSQGVLSHNSEDYVTRDRVKPEAV
jgi:hypothetical protein